MAWVVNATPRQAYPRETDPVPIVKEAVWAPGPVWMVAESLAPIGIRSSDRPVRIKRKKVSKNIVNLHTKVEQDFETACL